MRFCEEIIKFLFIEQIKIFKLLRGGFIICEYDLGEGGEEDGDVCLLRDGWGFCWRVS